MYPAEIVVGKMQSASSLQIVEFLTESIRQASEPADCLPHGQVLPLNKASAYVARVGAAITYPYYRLYHWRRRVAACGVMLPVIAIELD